MMAVAKAVVGRRNVVGEAVGSGAVAEAGGAGMVAATAISAVASSSSSSAVRGAQPSRPSFSRRANQAHTVSRPITVASSPATSWATGS